MDNLAVTAMRVSQRSGGATRRAASVRGWMKGGVITISEDQELLSLADGDLAQEWQEVEGHALRVFAHQPGRMCSDRIKISQQRPVPSMAILASLGPVLPFGVDVVGDDILNGELCPAVGIVGI